MIVASGLAPDECLMRELPVCVTGVADKGRRRKALGNPPHSGKAPEAVLCLPVIALNYASAHLVQQLPIPLSVCKGEGFFSTIACMLRCELLLLTP